MKNDKWALWAAGAIMLALTIGITLTGCSQRQADAFFAVSVAESRELHHATIQAVDVHDLNQTSQHQAMSPEVSEALATMRSMFEEDMEGVQQRVDDVHSEAGKIFSMASQIAGGYLPPAMVEAIKGYSPGESNPLDLMDTILLALGGGVVSTGLGQKFGKSRSSGVIEELKSKIAELEKVNDLNKPPTEVVGVVTPS